MTKTIQTQSRKPHHILAIIFATFFIAILSGKIVQAAACGTVTAGNNATVSAGCDNLILNGAGDVEINSGVTVGDGVTGSAVTVTGSSTSITNLGTVNLNNTDNEKEGIAVNSGVTLQTLTNSYSASISGTTVLNDDLYGIYNRGTITTLNNLGTINLSSNWHAGGIYNRGTIGTLTNSGTITVSRDTVGIYNAGTITTLTNNGTIESTDDRYAIRNSGTITNLINSGTISAVNEAIANDSRATITTLTNTGTITSTDGSWAIGNNGTLTTLNNLQGASSSALIYTSTLPTNYNIIIRSTTNYGQLKLTSSTGQTTFGIYSGGVTGVAASTVTAGYTYAAVLRGIGSANLTSLTGTYGSYSWTLAPQAACTTDCIYDLTISGPSGPPPDDTQKSIVATAASLQNTFALQNAVLANSLSYDCNTFGANNVCVSAGGRNTAVSAANGLNNTSGLLIAAYRPHPNYRIGAYVDQNLSVNNAGTTVRLGNSTPLIGLFGAWNEKLDGTGTEVKVSAAYGKKNTTINRQVIGTSEPGSGSSQLNSQGAQIIAKHGFTVTDKAIVSPYIGMRYTQNNMQGYTEGTSTTVTAPLAYSALNTRATTALAGVGVNYKVNPTVTTFVSAGLEADTKTANGSYSGTNSNISGLTPVNFNANPVKVRASAVLGAYYDVEKNQRFAITGAYRQESYKAVSTTTLLATYTVGL